MPAARDPLAGIRMLVVDGSNLAHALARRPAMPARAAVIGRIRAAVPADVAIELVFDGPPEPGSSIRPATRLTVRYGGRRSADALILERLDVEDRSAAGPDILVVTDDGDLARAARARGAATARTAWLISRLERGRLVSPSIGNARPPKAAGAEAGAEHAPGWRPGRGATTKHGNARRPPKARRRPPP
jgi:hypothetical protein